MNPSNSLPTSNTGTQYIIISCPRCGKLIVVVGTQKGKQCPVCRRRFQIAGITPIAVFAHPIEATRFIAGEAAKKNLRLDFESVVGFAPVSVRHLKLTRTDKVCGALPTNYQNFKAWIHNYFARFGEIGPAGIPAMELIAAATQAGFSSVSNFVERAINDGTLTRPKSYSLSQGY
ncbi:MAG TPA: hypothetical protein VKK79_10870 [Candidatus Lokiarchaeia archaeon]|nr:hypothetical protein [Candidatus Lokiarchaeia archaeon]